jgi:hypothetical protein
VWLICRAAGKSFPEIKASVTAANAEFTANGICPRFPDATYPAQTKYHAMVLKAQSFLSSSMIPTPPTGDFGGYENFVSDVVKRLPPGCGAVFGDGSTAINSHRRVCARSGRPSQGWEGGEGHARHERTW